MVEGKDLRKAGLKVTLPRLKILEILEGSQTRHMSAEEIYKNCSIPARISASRRSIACSRNSKARGWCRAIISRTAWPFRDQPRYAQHDHIVCMDCGLVEEFVDAEIETRQNAIAQRLGFKIEEHSLVLYGRCQRQNCPSRKLARNRMHLSRAPS